MKDRSYRNCVFINCPFDSRYGAMLDAIVFAVQDCGFVPRCALEGANDGRSRLTRIFELVSACRLGIHDISRTQLDRSTRLPRFNMPFELGVFLGATQFGNARHRSKACLVLDRERYRYRKFCSDLAGIDPVAHDARPQAAVRAVRNWLREQGRELIPGGQLIWQRYQLFRAELPRMRRKAKLDPRRLHFVDYTALIEAWLDENPW